MHKKRQADLYQCLAPKTVQQGEEDMREVVILSVARTAIGSFQGSLSTLPAPQLGAITIRSALEKSGIQPSEVSKVIMGNVLSAGVGQAPARQAAIRAGVPKSVPALTVNKVCGSGMEAVILGAQSILLGECEVVVTGGMESMSQAPFLLRNARSGFRMGNQTLVDSMIEDGLWDPYHSQHMGNCAELCAREYQFSRQEQDEYAIESFKRAIKAQNGNKFKFEIVPVELMKKKGENFLFEKDEGPSRVQFEKIPSLKPAFEQQGTVTAANASTINDGAATVVLASGEFARKKGIKPLARVISYGGIAQEPEWFTTAPIGAVRRTLEKANWKIEDVDLFEVNEAFAVVALATKKGLNIPMEQLNVWGGAIALGHPIGASGARVLVTLVSALRDEGLKKGIASICIGGGEATAVCVELFER